jgi:collagen type III alpha
MAPSPGLLMNPNTVSMNPVAMPLPPAPPSATETLFTNDFIQSVANGLDEFVDVGLFRGDGDLNFERDFGQWFNPDDVGMDLGKQ